MVSIFNTAIGTFLGVGGALALWEVWVGWQNKKAKKQFEEKLKAAFTNPSNSEYSNTPETKH